MITHEDIESYGKISESRYLYVIAHVLIDIRDELIKSDYKEVTGFDNKLDSN